MSRRGPASFSSSYREVSEATLAPFLSLAPFCLRLCDDPELWIRVLKASEMTILAGLYRLHGPFLARRQARDRDCPRCGCRWL